MNSPEHGTAKQYNMITDREKILAIVDNDCLTPSDAVILLEGDGFFRFSIAVDLYKRGMAKKIVFSGNIIMVAFLLRR